MSKINLIFAQSLNGVIGKDGKLPWHLPDELKEFKEKTLDNTVVMGRKTWDSLPNKMKPLPDRVNIVFTNKTFEDNTRYVFDDIENLIVLNIPKEYFEITAKAIKLDDSFVRDNDIWVIGGKSIYDLALPHANELHITTIMMNFEGDIFAPEIDFSLFDLISQSRIKYDSKTNTPFYTSVYRRKII